jgi:hypothetical protein
VVTRALREVTISDAIFGPDEYLTAELIGDELYIECVDDRGQGCIALDTSGAERLAQVLIDYLRRTVR